MRSLCCLLLLPFGLAQAASGQSADAEKTGWDQVPAILSQIERPSFPARDFDVTAYGAKGDGGTDCKPALDRAIAACHEAGGGRVVVPRGEWLVKGPIHLKNNVNLFVDEDAIVRFSSDPADYLPNVFTRFEGNELMNYSPLIYAFEQQNVAITGKGVFDGQASSNAWWPWKGKWGGDIDHGWRPGDPSQKEAIVRLHRMADQGVPAQEREFGDGHRLRPNFVQPYRSKNVLIEGVTFINSPMWVLHPVLCENVTIRGVTVRSHGPNNDGCNPESCRLVLIEECFFDTGDDCIALKSGRNADGRRIGVPTEQVIIRGCTMKDGHGGVTLGSEMSGGIRDIFAEECTMDSPRLERAIRLKSNSMRGGYLENLYVRNIEVGEVSDAVLHVDLLYDKERGDHDPLVRNIYLENITARKTKHPLYVRGIEGHPIESVTLKNCTFYEAASPSVIENVAQIILENFRQGTDQ